MAAFPHSLSLSFDCTCISRSNRVHCPPSCVKTRSLRVAATASSSSSSSSSQEKKDEASPNKDSLQNIWRDELQQQQSAPSSPSSSSSLSWSDEAFLSQSIEEDMHGLSGRKKEAAVAGSTEEKKGFFASLLDKFLVADFFFILFILAWFVAGLAEKAAFDTSLLIDIWLPLWPVLFQPALGIFMAGALWIAFSKMLWKK